MLKFIDHIIQRRPISSIIQDNVQAYKNEIGSAMLKFCLSNRWEALIVIWLKIDSIMYIYVFSSVYMCSFMYICVSFFKFNSTER